MAKSWGKVISVLDHDGDRYLAFDTGLAARRITPVKLFDQRPPTQPRWRALRIGV